MRPIVFFVAILASHALAIEPVKGLNGLDKRQTTDYCGMDNAGDDLWCINSSCCESTLTGIWSCYGPEDQCCATGYTCANGSQCYLDSLNYQWCVEGSNTVTAGTGAAPQTSALSSKTTGSSGTRPTQTTSVTSSPLKTNGAGAAGRAADALAKIVPLAGAAALLL